MLNQERRRKFLLKLAQWIKMRRVLLLALPVGIIAGLGSVVFYTLLDFSHVMFLDYLAGYRPMGPGGEHSLFPESNQPFVRWMLIVVPTLGGIISGWIIYTFAPEAEGHGTDAAIEAYHFRGASIRGRVPFVKIVASAITIGSGGSGGREGPIAQIGAGFGSIVSHALGLTDQERRILMMAGMGAGIGSIFHAPLAGAIFAAEILYQDIDMEYELLVPSAITSVIAYCVFSLFFGFGSLFATPSVEFLDVAEILPYTLLAVIMAYAARFYVKIFYTVRDLFRKLPVKPHFKPAIGGFLTGLIGFFLPESMYTGYGLVQQALDGHIVLKFMLVMAIARIFTTSFSIASGGSGGVFGPSVVIGGALGGAAGLIFQHFWPSLVPNPQTYVIVGMAGFFASAASTPFSTVIMVSEMTGNYELLLPAVWVSTLAFLLRGKRGIYEKQLTTRYDTPIHHADFMFSVLARLTVHEALSRYAKDQPAPVNVNIPLPELARLASAPFRYLPVINEKKEYLGVVSVARLKEALETREAARGKTLKDLVEPMITVYPWESLSLALSRMASEGTDFIVVLSEKPTQEVAGILYRSDVVRAYEDVIYRGINKDSKNAP